jgi:hypothetical protein
VLGERGLGNNGMVVVAAAAAGAANHVQRSGRRLPITAHLGRVHARPIFVFSFCFRFLFIRFFNFLFVFLFSFLFSLLQIRKK